MTGEFLGASERLPQDNPYTREFFELLGLKLHVHEMRGMAQQLDSGMLRNLGTTGRSTSWRNIIIGYPRPNRPPEEQVINVRHERMVLLPTPGDTEEVSRIIVRIPLPDIATRRHDDGSLKNAFIEVVSEAAREQFLLNEDGLWRYESAEDIYTGDGKEFQVLGNASPEPIDVVHRIDRYITTFGYEQQTNQSTF
jgi:hypothetical protein